MPTPTQQAILLGAGQSGAGFEIQQVVVRLKSDVNVLLLRDCWARAMCRHATLRSRFVLADDSVHEIEVVDSEELPFEIHSAGSIGEFLEQDRCASIDPYVAPTFRVSLVELPDALVSMVFTHHHALLDGRSFRIVLEEVLRDYLGRAPKVSESAVEFRKHCEAVLLRDSAPDRDYFTGLLRGVEPCLLPKSPPAGVGRQNRAEVRAHVKLKCDGIPFVGRAASFANVVQASWAVLLSRYCRTDDVVFGVTRSGRYLVEGGRDMVGCLINTVPTRVAIVSAECRAQLCDRLHQMGQEVRPHEFASLSEVQGWLGVEQPLFNTLIMFERYGVEEELIGAVGSDIVHGVQVHEQSSFPVVLAAYQSGRALDIALEFDPKRWSVEAMQDLIDRVSHLVSQFVDSPEQSVGSLNWLLPGEFETIVARSNGTLDPECFPSQRCSDLIAVAAARRPSALAYIDAAGAETSFQDLVTLSNRYVQMLRALPWVGGGTVAVLADRSLDVLAAQLACFSSGWTLLPLDPAWPLSRIKEVLRAARPGLLLCDQTSVLFSLGLLSHPLAQSPLFAAVLSESLGTDSGSDEGLPAYIIFTSGSSGAPKGVAVSHAALVAHGLASIDAYGTTDEDRVLQFAAPAFDVAFEESIPTLIAGGTIIERPASTLEDLHSFLSFVDERAVTVLNIPSAFFHLLMEHTRDAQQTFPGSVRLVVIGSEKPTIASVNAFLETNPTVRLVNAYGPTEATVTCCVCDLSSLVRGSGLQGEPPIGRSIGGNRVFILGPDGSVCPTLVPGEICISGPQVADGYLDDQERTSAKFGLSPIDGSRMYRSGDLGRLRLDGMIEFLGRVDEQVKIRGVRVEPGEVEHALRGVSGVSDAAVVVRDSGRGNELVAFVVAQRGVTVVAADVKQLLAAVLPACFVPADVRVCEVLPFRSNGKVDRGVLRRLALEQPTGHRLRELPAGDVESVVLGIFSRLLERDDIGVTDSFFELGGHSLLAVRLLSELNKISEQHLPLATIFAGATVRELAQRIGSREKAHLPSVVPLNAAANRYRFGVGTAVQTPVPCFFICGVHLYAPLAQAMVANRPIFGVFVDIEEKILRGDSALCNVQVLARAYLDALRTVQPTGPYVLGGASFGGIVAYELAQQLLRAGEQVQLLILLDTILPRAWHRKGMLGPLKRSVSRVIRRVAGDQVERWVSTQKARLGRGQSNDQSELSELDRARDRAFELALDRYDAEVEPYSGRSIIIRAVKPLDDEHDIDWHLGWAGLVPHETPVFGVDGDHLGILAEPGASEIAAILNGRPTKSVNQKNWSSGASVWVAALPSPYCMEFLYNASFL